MGCLRIKDYSASKRERRGRAVLQSLQLTDINTLRFHAIESKTYCKGCAKRMSSDGGIVDTESSSPKPQIASLSTHICREDVVTPTVIYASQNVHGFFYLNLSKVELSLLERVRIKP